MMKYGEWMGDLFLLYRPSIVKKNTGDVASEAEAVLRRRSIHSLYHRLYGFCCIIEY